MNLYYYEINQIKSPPIFVEPSHYQPMEAIPQRPSQVNLQHNSQVKPQPIDLEGEVLANISCEVKLYYDPTRSYV